MGSSHENEISNCQVPHLLSNHFLSTCKLLAEASATLHFGGAVFAVLTFICKLQDLSLTYMYSLLVKCIRNRFWKLFKLAHEWTIDSVHHCTCILWFVCMCTCMHTHYTNTPTHACTHTHALTHTHKVKVSSYCQDGHADPVRHWSAWLLMRCYEPVLPGGGLVPCMWDCTMPGVIVWASKIPSGPHR